MSSHGNKGHEDKRSFEAHRDRAARSYRGRPDSSDQIKLCRPLRADAKCAVPNKVVRPQANMSVLIETSIGAFTIDLYTDGMHRPRGLYRGSPLNSLPILQRSPTLPETSSSSVPSSTTMAPSSTTCRRTLLCRPGTRRARAAAAPPCMDFSMETRLVTLTPSFSRACERAANVTPLAPIHTRRTLYAGATSKPGRSPWPRPMAASSS